MYSLIVCEKFNLTIINQNTKTRLNPINNKKELLDYAIASNYLALKTHSIQIIEDDLLSDHFPLLFDLDINLEKHQKKELLYNYNKTDWTSFQNDILSSKSFPIFNNENNYPNYIDNYCDNIAYFIFNTFKKHCPLTPKQNRNRKLTKNTLTLIKYRRRLRRTYMVSRDPSLKTEINQLKKQINRQILADEKHRLKNDCSSIINDKNPKTFWKKLKTFINPITNPNTGNKDQGLKNSDGNLITNTKDQIQLFESHFKNIFNIFEGPTYDNNFKHEIDHAITNNAHSFTPNPLGSLSDNIPLLHNITINEWRKATLKCKNSSSPGLDNINYQMLKNTPPIFVNSHIIPHFNELLRLGYFPTPWKSAKVILIPKPNKDRTKPENYRPISLLPALGKIFERIIDNRTQNPHRTKQLLLPIPVRLPSTQIHSQPNLPLIRRNSHRLHKKMLHYCPLSRCRKGV